ncbi:MAG: FAD-dependent thymidylate synthase [Patescibacteria group bacterium]|nr:FAD-dependent thymidylate synthase [Patescibacteria group bacterium]
MSNQRRVYTLRDLPPEVKAVTFARCSRSPKKFDEIADDMTEEKSAEFHEKWVVGYGHSSVAEHAVLNIAVENISRLAGEVLENNRLASYTEKSSRYQIFNSDDFYFPDNMANSKLGDYYKESMKFLIKNYLSLYKEVLEHLKKQNKKTIDETDEKFERRLRPVALDSARFIMPVAMLANVGMTMNARCLEHAISKMLSHPLEEVQNLGKDIKRVSEGALPTLVKYAQPNIYMMETEKTLRKLSQKHCSNKSDDASEVVLVDYQENAEEFLVSALLYRYCEQSFLETQEKVKAMSEKEKNKVIEESLKRLGNHDIPLRELEHVYYNFDCLMDEGAYYEFKRHRICTQTVQDLTINNGYVTPPIIKENKKLNKRFLDSIEKSEEAYNNLKEDFIAEASYFALNAHKRRVFITLNLRTLYHFIKLRSAPNAHFTIQQIANQMYDLIKNKHPLLVKYIQFKK